ncbi:MAG: lipopolysaccharide biosynthesis protein [Pirellulales bacterium]|nr:lipopolysaccharide biosynthesis protein [Pirellulales bacterium]
MPLGGLDPTEFREPHASLRPLQVLSLRRNFSWALVGNVAFAASQWGVLAVLAKLGDAAVVGRFALALAVTAPAFMLANLQLRSIQATDARRLYRFGHYLALRLIGASAALAVLLVVAAAGYAPDVAAVIVVVAVGKAFDSLADVALGLAQQHERLDRGARARILAGAASLAGLSLAVWLTHDVLWGAAGWAAGYAAAALACPVWLGRDLLREALHADGFEKAKSIRALLPIWDVATLAGLAKLALPLGIVMMLVSLKFNMPRYFIESAFDEKALGIFAALAYLMTAGHLVALALGQAAAPRLAKLHAAGESGQFWAMVGKLIALAAAGGAIAVGLAAAIGRPVLTVLYAPEYAEYLAVFVCLAAVTGIQFASSFLGEAMTATRSFRSQVPLLLAVVAATTAACAVLVPRYGLMGAVLASGIGEVGQVAGSFAIVLHAMRRGSPV